MSELWPALGTAFRQSVPFLCALLVLAGVVFFFARCCLVSLPRKGSLEWVALQERRPFSLTLPCHPMARRDALPLVLITAVYAATAFFQLGSFTAPQSALDFGEDQTVTIPLSRTIYLTKLRYFSNLGTGSYNVEVSADGETWYTLWQREDENGNTVDYWAAADGYAPSYALPQEYNDLFKWLEVVPENPQNVRYLRITGRADKGLLELGELALYDNGVFTEGAGLVAAADPTPLFDEQDTVPEQSSWYNSTYFDEIYHPRTALEHIENVYPYEVSHPPLGKLIISLGIRAFGMTPFGWRFMGALFGVLMLPILYVFLKNLFGKTPVAACGTALFAFDFMHLTQTRIATIDTYGVFFILLMYFFLYRYLALPAGTPFRRCALPLFLSGLFWGIGAASKWTVIYGAVGLAVLYFIGLGCKLREWPAQVPGKLPWLWKVLLFSVLCFVLLPALIYTLSYWPYAAARGNEAGLGGILLEIVSWPFVHLPEVLRGERDLFINGSQNIVDIMLQNQHFMLTYHEGVTASHPWPEGRLRLLQQPHRLLDGPAGHPGLRRPVLPAEGRPDGLFRRPGLDRPPLLHGGGRAFPRPARDPGAVPLGARLPPVPPVLRRAPPADSGGGPPLPGGGRPDRLGLPGALPPGPPDPGGLPLPAPALAPHRPDHLRVPLFPLHPLPGAGHLPAL